MSPAELTLRFFAREGYTIAVVEKTVNVPQPGGRRLIFKQDLWGFADGLAFRPGNTTTFAVQWTVGARFAEHVAKCAMRDREVGWTLTATDQMPRRLLVFGWRQVGDHGKRKVQQARVVEIRAGVALPEVDGPDDAVAHALGLIPCWMPGT